MYRKRKNELNFQREFAKDVKRMNKPETHKPDLVDLFVEGELSLPEFLDKMSQKTKSQKENRRKKVNQTVINNARSSVLNNSTAQPEQKSVFLSIQDILEDIERNALEETPKTKPPVQQASTPDFGQKKLQFKTVEKKAQKEEYKIIEEEIKITRRSVSLQKPIQLKAV